MRRVLAVGAVFAVGLLGGVVGAYAFGVYQHHAGSDYFTDCSASSPHDEDVGWAAEYPILRGLGDGTYHPTDPVSREQMTSYLMRQSPLDITATVMVMDDVYFGGYYYGIDAYNNGRITYDQYLGYKAANEWLRALFTYEMDFYYASGAMGGTKSPDNSLATALRGVAARMGK
jgi:hypothetical protein